MLPKQARLRRRTEFSDAVRGGSRAGTATVVAHLSRTSSDGARAGFVVSRAVGPAVVRNRVRRRLRHLVLARLDRLPPDARLVLRATPAAATSSFADLAADLDRTFDRLSLRSPR